MAISDYPRILVVLPGLYTSTIINVVKPLLQLHQAKKIQLDVSFEYLVRQHNLAWADAMVFCRNIEPEYNHILMMAVEWGKPIIYDLDDNLFEAPDTTPGLRYFRAPARQAQLKEYLNQASLVRVYAPALQRYLADYNSNVVKVNGPLDWSLVPTSLPRNSSSSIRLVYATARLEDEIGDMLVNSLQRILDAYAHVEVIIWGPRLKGLYKQPRVYHLNVIMDYDRFFYKFARQGFDIGLAPLPNDLFHRCKTNVKYREYAACGVAGVYSNVEVYSECVQDEVTGLLVDPDEEAWFSAIARLIEDVTLRENIQHQAQVSARRHYNQEKMQADWLAHIQKVLANSAVSGKDEIATKKTVPYDSPAGTSSSNPIALIAGILGQTIRYTFRIIPMLKDRGLHVTLGRIRLHLNSFKQLVSLKIMLRRMQRNFK